MFAPMRVNRVVASGVRVARCCASGASVGREEVLKTARLARLEIAEGEVEKTTAEFQKIIGLFNSMGDVADSDEDEDESEHGDSIIRDDVAQRFDNVYVCRT